MIKKSTEIFASILQHLKKYFMKAQDSFMLHIPSKN